MERDFLGLNSKDSFAAVKVEVKDGGNDSAFMRGSGMQWYFSNKASTLPQFMSFDGNNKPAALSTQKNCSLSRQGGTNYTITGYPVQHIDANGAHRPHEARKSSLSNQSLSVAMGKPFFNTHVGNGGQGFSSTSMKHKSLGGIPVTTPLSILPTSESMAATDDSRNNFKLLGSPVQLTIFYEGEVNVYDVSPEKAQAIMFLAGNGSSMIGNKTNSSAQIQGSTEKLVVGDTVPAISSHVSDSSHTGVQSRSGSSSTNEMLPANPMGGLAVPCSQPEHPIVVTSIGSTTVSLIPSAVPQARKASLARFLEKRKERIISTVPYSNLDKKAPPEFNSIGFTGNLLSGW